MKKIIVSLFFVTLFVSTYFISAFTINKRSNGYFSYDTYKKNLSAKQIYEQVPQFVKYDNVYRNCKVTQSFSEGIIFPIVKNDTICDNTINADDDRH
jgi:hypothetical protein